MSLCLQMQIELLAPHMQLPLRFSEYLLKSRGHVTTKIESQEEKWVLPGCCVV